MAHISGIGAGIYTDLSVALPTTDVTTFPTTAAGWQALFVTEIPTVGGTRAAGTFVSMDNIREYPPIGTPANIVNVPTYGQATSSQVQGQADAPSLELTLNYVSNEWGLDSTSLLAPLVGNGKQYPFRLAVMNAKPTGTTATAYASTAAGIGTVQNSQYYWVGKFEALTVAPQLTDANTATLTLSIQGQFWGAYTI